MTGDCWEVARGTDRRDDRQTPPSAHFRCLLPPTKNTTTMDVICLYRENAIAIESEARDPNGGNVYYVTLQITFHILEFARKERNLHCDVVPASTGVMV